MSEQYMDFIRNRMFRETLLVRARAAPDWAVHPDRLRRLHVASGSRPEPPSPDAAADAPARFHTPSGATLATNRPVLKAAMRVLGGAWPGTVPFDALRRAAREAMGGAADDPAQAEADARELASGLLHAYLTSDLVELHAVPVAAVRTPGERPVAPPSARVRAAEGRGFATISVNLRFAAAVFAWCQPTGC